MALVRKSKMTDGLGVGLVLVLSIAVAVANATSLVKWTWSWFGVAGLAVVGALAALWVLGRVIATRANRRE